MTQEQRSLLADKLCDVANLILGALLFGQLVSGVQFSNWRATVGVLAWLAFLAAGVLLKHGE